MTGEVINLLGVGVDSNALLIAITLIICTFILIGNIFWFR